MPGWIIILIILILCLGGLPSWPYASSWGYGPSGLLFIVLIVLLIMALTGRL